MPAYLSWRETLIVDEPTLEEWSDRHHVEIVRTHATNLDGLGVGKYVKREKFLKSLPKGHTIADMALAQDITGNPHLTVWHDFRHGEFGDICLQPAIDTIVSDVPDPALGHCLCDFVSIQGAPLELCPRTLLKRVTSDIAALGYNVKAAFELAFFISHNSFEQARRRGYRNLQPAPASTNPNIYLLRNAHHAKPFMDEVIKRLNWQKFSWESWSDEGGVGQVELNFSPADPVTAADTIVRARQIVYEVAVDLDMCISFLPSLGAGYGNGLHVAPSLPHTDGSAAFLQDGAMSSLMQHWIAGITATMAGAP